MSPNLDLVSTLPHYEVAAGLIQSNGKILITQRRLDDTFGGLWELPGGKQEGGETLEQCLIREIHEELNFKIDVAKKLMSISHRYAHVEITLHVFLCSVLNGAPEAKGVQDWRWIDLQESDQYNFTAADLSVIKNLKEINFMRY